jgi:diaminopimelate epimerase
MEIRFQKMNGAGNDFVMIDNRESRWAPVAETIRKLCDRRRGIGADGLILIEPEDSVDFHMRYFNSDGGEAGMCGNGARCAALFARNIGLGARTGDEVRLSFKTGAGALGAVVRGSRVAIAMTKATGYREAVSLEVGGGGEVVHVVDTGVPHAVSVEKDVGELGAEGVVGRGRPIRFHEKFAPEGVNVDFVSVIGDGRVGIRTYERGVENETLACGTGAVAAAVVLAHLGLVAPPVDLVTQGKELLRVSFSLTPEGADNVLLEGPAAVNFVGIIEV